MCNIATNIRHDLDPVLVNAAIQRKLASHEATRVKCTADAIMLTAKYEQSVAAGTVYKDWHHKPQDVQSVANMVDTWIKRELEYYLTVRVIELPTGEKRFVLVYGDVDDVTVINTGGTGPFVTYDAAVKWFTRGGR